MFFLFADMFSRGDEKINGTLVFIGSLKERCVAAESAATIETGMKKPRVDTSGTFKIGAVILITYNPH